jgi:POT family proton-dependent oligopeptide transporter
MPVFPRQIPFIVTTEACERFSYYGMLSVLTLYLKNDLALGADDAKSVVHLFKMAVYFLPLAGAWLADRWLGRYRTIMSLALFYCLGHGALALFEGSRAGVFTGLALIALGAGGIKPCVSAFIGDQFDPTQQQLLPRVYGLFYWAINLGALFGFALIPLLRDHHGFAWAFGVPGIFMAVATLVFRAGASRYIKVLPAAASPPRSSSETAGAGKWSVVGRVALVLLPVPVFWALFDQINSSWVLQGERMTPFSLGGYKVDAERIQSVSALLVLLWVPILTFGVYPWLERVGVRATPLRRMGAGMVFAALSFVICAWLQSRIERGETLTLAWQVAPYIVLELGEVLLSASGLEFAYAQAPPALKSTVMSLWLLTTALGNFLVAVFTALNSRFVHATGAAEFLFYAGLMLAVAAVFASIASRYRDARAADPAAG